MSNDSIIEPKINSPGVYHMLVSGKVRHDVTDYFQCIQSIKVRERIDSSQETVLSVHIRDQSELLGLIHTLSNWQHVIFSVQLLEEKLNEISNIK